MTQITQKKSEDSGHDRFGFPGVSAVVAAIWMNDMKPKKESLSPAPSQKELDFLINT